ncbi:MAG: gamma carbonic anhydrase family protein [Spirochaetales bacterium]|nr:MAG: gamma carbonic anhydrase family protein [Spirochaetales bacterium]
MYHSIDDKIPSVAEAAFIAWNAEVLGEVYLGRNSSVWFSATIRGDLAPIFIGEGTNIQDNSVVHVDTDQPARIGNFVTVGHNAILHGCTVGDGCMIGMGSIILNRAKIGKECIVGAGALVTEGKEFPERSLIIGSPARSVRTLTDEDAAKIQEAVKRYIERSKHMSTLFGNL